MTAQWDEFLSVLAAGEFSYRSPEGRLTILPNDRKPVVAAHAMAEQGRGAGALVVGTPQFKAPLNFFSLKKRADLNVPFPVGSIWYDGGDGLYEYFTFRTVRECLLAYCAFVFGRSPYAGVWDHLGNDRDFIDFIGVHFCPPGYPGSPSWPIFSAKSGGRTYTGVICDQLLPEARALLAGIGWKPMNLTPTPIPPTPGGLTITNGILQGPNVKYWWVKNHYSWERKQTVGIVLHEPDARSAGNEDRGLGVVYDWSIPSAQKSAHGLIWEDGMILQTVNLLQPAWHCAGWNDRTMGFEFACIGPFWPWQEILGYFYRFRNQLWMQRIAKADTVLYKGMYWPKIPYTPAQYAAARALVAAIRSCPRFRPDLGIRGHEELDPGRGDPGPFDWLQVDRGIWG